MLGRAVQLTFPHQTPREELICDSTTAERYLEMALHAQPPSLLLRKSVVDAMRQANADGSYLWGDYPTKLELRPLPDVRLLNLETAVTVSIDNPDVPLAKCIHYHLHALNLSLAFSKFASTTFRCVALQHEADGAKEELKPSPYVISLANNHAMDFGRKAMEQETLSALATLPGDGHAVGIGRTFEEAAQAVRIPMRLAKGAREFVDVVAVACQDAGTPMEWRATQSRSGMVVIPALFHERNVDVAVTITSDVLRLNQLPRRESLLVLSIHWGQNWAYREGENDVEGQYFRRLYAHRVIRELGVDMIYGHSSHHIRGMELLDGKLILYGAGDLINDYEGFSNPGEEAYSPLGGLFCVDLCALDGKLVHVSLLPTKVHCLQLQRVMSDTFDHWDPRQQRMVSITHGVSALARALNALSARDAGPTDTPVTLRVATRALDGAVELVFP